MAPGLGKRFHALTLGQILANQAIGIFIGSSLPGVVRRGEVEFGLRLGLDLLVSVKLSAIISSN